MTIPKVMIATPCKDGRVDINYATGLAASGQFLTSAGISYSTAHVSTSNIDNARNVLATHFLKSDCTHLLFIDDDMAWSGDLPLRLLEENVDIVGVPYRKKIQRIEYTVLHPRRVGSMEHRPWMIMVDALGMGMTLIRKNVLEKMASEVPEYHCFAEEVDMPQHLFFRHELVVDERTGRVRYESEDFHFCRLAKKSGFEIWGYIDEDLAHIGRAAFTGPYNLQISGGIPHGFTSKRSRKELNLVGIEK